MARPTWTLPLQNRAANDDKVATGEALPKHVDSGCVWLGPGGGRGMALAVVEGFGAMVKGLWKCRNACRAGAEADLLLESGRYRPALAAAANSAGYLGEWG